MPTEPTMTTTPSERFADTLAAHEAFLKTPCAAVYIAQRVRVAARQAVREQDALERWFLSKLPTRRAEEEAGRG